MTEGEKRRGTKKGGKGGAAVIPSRRKGCFLSSRSCTPIRRDPTRSNEVRRQTPRHSAFPLVHSAMVRFSLALVLHVPLDCSGFIITRWSPTTRSSGT